MGVLKLWQLLLTIAKPLTIDDLSGKILAIDASIWIVKIDSLFNSSQDKLKSILTKIMTLKRNNILPVFVFDGVPPAIKRRTLEQRARRRIISEQTQAKKMAQIEVMRLLQGDNSKLKQKSAGQKQKLKQEQLNEIKSILQNLCSYKQQDGEQVNMEALQKFTMQSEILNRKYKLMLDINPEFARYEHFIPIEQYEYFDLQRKKEYLYELEENQWKNYKNKTKKSRQSMNYEEKLRFDLQIIEKKCSFREEQDKYYRKLMQRDVKIENGFEIIETVYNGRKVVQKRKIKGEKNGYRKGKFKYDFSCFNFREGRCQSQDQSQHDQFLSEFCSTQIPKKVHNPQSNSSIIIKQDSSKKNTYPQRQKRSKQKHKIKKADLKENKGYTIEEIDDDSQNIVSNQHEFSEPYFYNQIYQKDPVQENEPYEYINKQQFQKAHQHLSQEQGLNNRDQLPQQPTNDFLSYQNHSTDNIGLQNLLLVLGIPFIVAPGEAEAQCAALEREGIVDGIITQDSDVFLFGGRHVYRGVFQNNIRYYNYSKIQERLKLNQEKLIIFALLLGSDYTTGVKGIGLINAMEILKVFGSFSRLQKFKKWAQLPDVMLPEEQRTSELLKNATAQEKQFYELHRKFKNYWYVDESFNQQSVPKAYLQPSLVSHKQLLQLKKQGHFQQKQHKKEALDQILINKLQLEGVQLDHYKRLLGAKFKKRKENLLDYWQKEDVELAKIRSKRLKKSINENND